AAKIHVLPTLWFRNTWSWEKDEFKPSVRAQDRTVLASHPKLGERVLYCDGGPELLFTENESNASRLWGQSNPSPFVKDAFHEFLIAGKKEAVNPSQEGTKAAAHYELEIPAGGSRTVRLRLSKPLPSDPFVTFDQTFAALLAEANEFYDRITSPSL